MLSISGIEVCLDPSAKCWGCGQKIVYGEPVLLHVWWISYARAHWYCWECARWLERENWNLNEHNVDHFGWISERIAQNNRAAAIPK